MYFVGSENGDDRSANLTCARNVLRWSAAFDADKYRWITGNLSVITQ